MPTPYRPQYNTTNLLPHQYSSTWNSGATKTIRVPVALADAVIEYARILDSGGLPSTSDIPNDAIAAIIAKVEAKEPGYRSNSATKLIKDLRSLNSE